MFSPTTLLYLQVSIIYIYICIYIFSRPYYWKNHPEKPLFPIPSIHGSIEYKQNKPILTEAEFILHHVSKFWGCKFTFNLPSNIVVAPKITWNTARKKMKICSWCNALTDITGTFPCHAMIFSMKNMFPKANSRKYIYIYISHRTFGHSAAGLSADKNLWSCHRSRLWWSSPSSFSGELCSAAGAACFFIIGQGNIVLAIFSVMQTLEM